MGDEIEWTEGEPCAHCGKEKMTRVHPCCVSCVLGVENQYDAEEDESGNEEDSEE